jgi:hypothetical protein
VATAGAVGSISSFPFLISVSGSLIPEVPMSSWAGSCTGVSSSGVSNYIFISLS